jgi:glycosyltransferase involved in cell wall biosynthesis
LDLSIIVPAFNRKEVLKPCLEAILAQLQAGDELLVIDDASDWPVREYLEELEKGNE